MFIISIIMRRKIISLFTLIAIFLLLAIGSNILPEVFFNERREYQLLEAIQTTILFMCIGLQFQYRKIFIRVSNVFTFLIRQFFFIFLLYEELSFLSFRINKMFFNKNLNLYNHQQEFNFHNNIIFQQKLFSITIPTTNITFSLTLDNLVYILILFLIGYGSYFSLFKGIKYFFLDRNYAYFTLIFIPCFILGDFGMEAINNEMIELSIYSLLLLDTFKKKKIMLQKYS